MRCIIGFLVVNLMGDDVAEEKVKTAIDEFARFYILNGCKDAKGAAIKAGYSEKTADQQASRMLKNVKVKKLIDEYKNTVHEKFIWSKEEKLKRLQDIADMSIRSIHDQFGNEKAESLSSAVSAIKEHNVMQGDNAPVMTETTLRCDETLASRLTSGSKK